MAEPSILEMQGARPAKPAAPMSIYINRWITGLVTQRNPFVQSGGRPDYRFYGGRPDTLIDGLNMEVTNSGTLKRRPGFSSFSSGTFPSALLSAYSFIQILPGGSTSLSIMASTKSKVYTVTSGATTQLFSNADGVQAQTFFHGVGKYLYFGHGGSDLKKWANDAQSVTNWGIVAAGGSGSSTSAYAGAGQTDTISGGSSSQTGVGSSFANVSIGSETIYGQGYSSQGPWSSGSNTQVLDGVYATCDVSFDALGGTDYEETDYLRITGLGLSLPGGATVTGVAVTLQGLTTAKLSGAGSAAWVDGHVQLVKSNVIQSTDRGLTGAGWGGTNNYGSSSDTWYGVVAGDIDSNFGVAVTAAGQVTAGGTELTPTYRVFIDYVAITVYYTTPSLSWTTPNGIAGAPNHGGSPAYTSITLSGTSPNLRAITYGFSVSGGVVGIGLVLAGYTSGGSFTVNAQLMTGGVAVSSVKTATFNGGGAGADTSITLGGSTDNWGYAWSTTAVNSSGGNIAVQLTVTSGASATCNFDSAQLVVYTSTALSSPGFSGTGLTGTYQYCYCLGNSVSGHVGSPSNIITVTPSNQGVQLSVTGSTADAQVNQLRVFRTKAGGAIFYEVPSLVTSYSTGTQTVTDTTADGNLLTQNIAPTGLTNNPPPAGMTVYEFHANRLWGAVGNIVYYATGPDIVLGNPQEAFNPLNTFVFPTNVYGLLSTSQGLLVFTADDVHIIRGTISATAAIAGASGVVFYARQFIPNLGVLSYNAVWQEGNQIYVFSNTSQLVQIDATGVNEPGFAIGDLLGLINPANAVVTSHVGGSKDKAVYVSDGNSTIYRLNPNQAPEGGPVWSAKATVTGGVGWIGSLYTALGTRQLLIAQGGSGTNHLFYRNPNLYSDNGTAYSCYATLGNLVLALPGQLADVHFITTEAVATGTKPAVSVLLDEISGTFEALPNSVNDPPDLSASNSLYANRFYLTQGQAPVVTRSVQIKVSFPAEASPNELLTLTVNAALYPE
ncbi:MAG: hypothetical protein JWQ87_2015 [Candidatus Sulfotelmatobacter sp.]|nr:hypothetical protein [Candidatus Sulfotelmatobacter sp.]